MPWSNDHVQWLKDTGERLATADGKDVEVWEFCHQDDDEMLTRWAKHFRNHYCLDSEIDFYCRGIGCTRTEYLDDIKFPDPKAAPGPSIRSGDFSEVLVADFLEYILGFWVPRTRYGDKTVRNESTKGTDLIGFYFEKDGEHSLNDRLALFEVKAQYSGKKADERLQDAVDGSIKDIARKAESLNAIKQRLFTKKDIDGAIKIERFQNQADNPYQDFYGAVALFENAVFDKETISTTDSSSHPHLANLKLVVIRGEDMMKLVHALYRRAADEA
ncbi:DUF1837 domain-containing protein [Pseudodesulfovibrio sp. JC047]|uniref:Hachiman antiphage defense system protein HamA n=1 Tax=Pseudodesulfovibrio sp. JC047 TaxID=2683199 RepID=UPI0013CF9407|nr:Hachiman antiphage defense system protein HamA [Pseudodesulfovibrio sp. JC047]NDV18763.1 DUF1837 domain-containing protein [Pseudodesulfovibrio sp. JC047]